MPDSELDPTLNHDAAPALKRRPGLDSSAPANSSLRDSTWVQGTPCRTIDKTAP